jgi:hypothetical protein
MGTLGNNWQASEWQDMKDAWLGTRGFVDRQVIFRKFLSLETKGNQNVDEEFFRVVNYAQRADHVWLSQVKVFDTVKGGYFTTGDLDIYSNFRIQGYSPGYTLPSGVVIKEYGGDQIVWNGKVWVVADQIEPVQFGYQAPQLWWKTTMRRTDRSGAGNTVGP